MSGDAAGVIVLGALALAVLPFVLAGAAAIAVGYGVIKVGGIIAKKIIEDQGVKKIEVNNCSAELSAMYANINSAIENANSLQKEFDNTMQEQYTDLESEIKNMGRPANGVDIREFEEKLKQKEAALEKLVSMSTSQTTQRVVSDIKRVVKESNNALEVAKNDQVKLVNWASTLAADKAQQQAVAVGSMNDAKATIRVLKTLKGVFGQVGPEVEWEAIDEKTERGSGQAPFRLRS